MNEIKKEKKLKEKGKLIVIIIIQLFIFTNINFKNGFAFSKEQILAKKLENGQNIQVRSIFKKIESVDNLNKEITDLKKEKKEKGEAIKDINKKIKELNKKIYTKLGFELLTTENKEKKDVKKNIEILSEMKKMLKKEIKKLKKKKFEKEKILKKLKKIQRKNHKKAVKTDIFITLNKIFRSLSEDGRNNYNYYNDIDKLDENIRDLKFNKINKTEEKKINNKVAGNVILPDETDKNLLAPLVSGIINDGKLENLDEIKNVMELFKKEEEKQNIYAEGLSEKILNNSLIEIVATDRIDQNKFFAEIRKAGMIWKVVFKENKIKDTDKEKLLNIFKNKIENSIDNMKVSEIIDVYINNLEGFYKKNNEVVFKEIKNNKEILKKKLFDFIEREIYNTQEETSFSTVKIDGVEFYKEETFEICIMLIALGKNV